MIVIIDNYGGFTYNLYQIVGAIEPHTEVIGSKDLNVQALKNLNPSALLLSSGCGTAEENPLNIEIVKNFSEKIPILGISLGHLAIAEAFHAKLEPVKEFQHGKSSFIRHRGEEIFKGLDDPLQVGCYHSFVVSKAQLPKNLKILGEAQDGSIMSLQVIGYPCFGVQFHPEAVLTPQGGKLIKKFLDLRGSK